MPETGPIIELRQYTLHAGQRDVLIELFERELLEPQEALGMQLFGQFRDLDRPDRFVWLRGFTDMAARAEALGAFYGGPVWQAHRAAANATMVDSDNVLLLHPATEASGFGDAGPRPGPGATATDRGLFVATIHPVAPGAGSRLTALFVEHVAPALTAAGATIAGAFATEHGRNTFPRLPVREGEDVFVWIARYPDAAGHERSRAALAAAPPWRDHIAPALAEQRRGAPEVLRLAPTPRSRLGT